MSSRAMILAWLAIAAFAVPVARGASTAPTGGLLVTRVSSEQWRIRLVAGQEPRRFTGSVDASAPFYTTTGLRLEAGDSVALASPTTLDAVLRAWPGGTDTIAFSTSAMTKLCLRSAGPADVKVYLGDSLSEATPAAFPVALQGADACGSQAPPPVVTPPRKYHAGHYVALMRGNDDQAVMAETVAPGIRGFLKRYTWRSLEPVAGQYDFREVRADLDWASAHGLQLVVMIEDKTFVLERPTPAYLDRYTIRNRAGGYTALRWNDYVVTRMKALVTALGRFDGHAAFEGIATQETAPGFDDAVLDAHGYTAEKYRDAYIAVLTTAADAMPTSRVFWYMNFFPRNQAYIGSVADAVHARGVVMGGPDVLPDNAPLLTRSYPFFGQFASKMPLFGQVEPVCYSAPHATGGYATRYWTMPELLRYARENLHVDYMFWVRLPRPTVAGGYDWSHAAPVVARDSAWMP